VDQRDLEAKFGQERASSTAVLPAADNGDLLAAIEEAVAGGRRRPRQALEMHLAGQAPATALGAVAMISVSPV